MSDFIAIQKRGDKWYVWTDSVKNHFPSPSGNHQFCLNNQLEALSTASELYFDLEGVPYGIMPLPDKGSDPIDLAIKALEAVEYQKHYAYLVRPWCPWCKVDFAHAHKSDCLRERTLAVLRGSKKRENNS